MRAFAGTGVQGFSGDGGPATEARFGRDVLGIAADANGDVYLGDPGNRRIRKVDPSGMVTTVAGTGDAGSGGDGGPAVAATLEHPTTIAVDAAGDILFVDRGSGSVRMIDPSGVITTIAGTGRPGYAGDCGPASSAEFSTPYGLGVHDGAVYVADEGNHRIRAIRP